MNAARQLGWTIEGLHERVAACEALAMRLSELDPDGGEPWTAGAPLAFLRLVDELLALGKEFRPPAPATLMRRISRLDERLTPREVGAAAERLRAWLVRQEGDLLERCPAGEGEAEPAPDNLVALPKGAQPGGDPERLRGLVAERWVALPVRAGVRARVTAAREALGALALVLAAANGDDDLPFGTLDRKRLAMVAQAARHTLGGPLAERGLLRSLRENAAVMERRATSAPARRTARSLRIALEALLDDLG